jgi:hypothetical protein
MTEGYAPLTYDEALMTERDEKLLPTKREDVLQSIEFGMRFRGGKASNAARDVATAALAAMVLDHLETCGYVIKMRPPAVAHSTSLLSKHLTD